MKQVLIQKGKVIIQDVPAPQVEPGALLVKVEYSCISTGTELSAIKNNSLSLRERAFRQPANISKVLQMVKSQGLSSTRNLVQERLGAEVALGYSAAGIVLELGEGIQDLHIGSRVACSGSQCAFHAEVIRVPRNLAVLVPENLGLDIASTAGLGAIALQGIRRLNPALGESVVVIGLGILGQLTAQLLKANGCRVIGIDLDEKRVLLARKQGMEEGIICNSGKEVEEVLRLTNGNGADAVIITAKSGSDSLISNAFKMCRKKAKVVLVGDVGLNLNREDLYQKELDLLVSTSSGPGRYDPLYEEKGLDYPIAYVRWTENRNMEEYLRLISAGKLNITPLISGVYPQEEADTAYETLENDSDKPLIALLAYPQTRDKIERETLIKNPAAKPAGERQIRIALIGSGSFAKQVHLPTLRSLSGIFHIQAIASRTGHNAQNTSRRFAANYATTDYRNALNDNEVDAVLIATRHNLHTAILLEALNAGKHVFVEKPLALNKEELDSIELFYNSRKDSEGLPIMLTGFNRRFSKYARYIKELLNSRRNPMIINYRFNAGHIPSGHWVNSEEGGGRNIGEACHSYDLFTFFIDSKVSSVDACSIRPATGYYSRKNNFVATVSFQDGSLASLTYTELGANDYPKEYLEIFFDGNVIVLDDFRRLSISGAKRKIIQGAFPEKGHKEALSAFGRAIQQGGAWPIPLWQQLQATEIALQVEGLLLEPIN